MATHSKTTKKTHDADTAPINPFFTAINGITLLFSSALSVGIVILLINAVSSMMTFMQDDEVDFDKYGDSYEQLISRPQDLLVIGFIILAIVIFAVVVSAMLHGIGAYTASRLAQGEKVTIKEAFYSVLERFGGYLVFYIWMNFKIFLWTLLFIIPGIFAYYRYSFAGIVFFDKDLKHEHAIKESIRLTKGGRMTIFSSQLLFNMITFGYIDQIISIATNTELYRTYTALDKANQPKPSIHWLSWATLAVPFVLFFLAMLFFIGLAIVIGLNGGQFS